MNTNTPSSSFSPAGFEAMVAAVLAPHTDRPLIITEFGQSCCPTNGACEECPGTYDGKTMGYDEAILAIANKHQVSWLPWAWRPGAVKFPVKTYVVEEDVILYVYGVVCIFPWSPFYAHSFHSRTHSPHLFALQMPGHQRRV